ncbi:MAG: hypothetical protein ACOYNR_15120 [Blastocatellia bacterium]
MESICPAFTVNRFVWIGGHTIEDKGGRASQTCLIRSNQGWGDVF